MSFSGLLQFRTRALAAALLFGIVVGSVAPAFAGVDEPETPKTWPESIRRKILGTADRLASQLSTAIFDQMDEIKTNLYKFPSGKGQIGIKFHRDLYDNFDPLQTYTVIDRVQLSVAATPLQNLSTYAEPLGNGVDTPYVGVIFQPQAMIEWTNVRPVRAFDYVRGKVPLPAPSTSALEQPIPAPSPDPAVSELNPELQLRLLDPELRVHFKKVPNLLTFPFRLPLSRSDVSRMKDGEIISYAFDGQVQVGLSAGLKIIPDLGVLEAGITASATAILHGRYEISVLREDERYARVKLTRLKERGGQAGIKVGIERYGVYDGLMLFKGTWLQQDHFLQANLKVVPFQWSTSHMRAEQFDVVYRYDLNDSAGKQAFHKAVLGGFSFSNEIAEQDHPVDGPKRVERIVERDGVRKTKVNNFSVTLNEVLKLGWNRKKDSLEATLQLPDGTHHIMQGVREQERKQKVLFGTSRENRNKRVTLLCDEELYAKRDPESVFMIAEITDEDTSTRGSELNKAIESMESFLRKPDLLPSVPRRIPMAGETAAKKRVWYGRSSFYYGYSLSLVEIAAFLNADYNKVKERAEHYFDETDSLRFIQNWHAAREAYLENKDRPESTREERKLLVKKLYDPLRALFTDKFPIEEMTAVIFDVLAGHSIDYFVTAQNVSFGRIQERGKTITAIDKVLTLTDTELGFQSYNQRAKRDPEAVVGGVQVKKGQSGLLDLTFTLASNPENVFFRLYRVTGFKKQKLITELVVNNHDQRFKAGLNTLKLDPYSLDMLTAKLSRELKFGDFYSIAIGYSRKADRFGQISTARFEVAKPYPRVPGQPLQE